MEDDNWVDMAFKDDTLVAHALLRLRRHYLDRPPPFSTAPSLRWVVKRRRSGPVSSDGNKPRKSPTSPLSWSRDTSSINGSDAIVCGEWSNRPIDASGSKVGDHNETAAGKRSTRKRKGDQSETATNKRARRIKVKQVSRQTSDPSEEVHFPVSTKTASAANASSKQETADREHAFLLPDLNLPYEDDSTLMS